VAHTGRLREGSRSSGRRQRTQGDGQDSDKAALTVGIRETPGRFETKMAEKS
jgi:hypothetical protein